MPSNELDAVYSLVTSWPSEVAILAAGTALAVLAAYRSFTLGRAFAIPSYRSRALWLGVANLSFVAFIFSYLTSAVFQIIPFLVNDAIASAVSLVFFLWLDSTINVALGQDYFHRNTLYWKQLRIPFWILTAFAVIESSIAYAVASDISSPWYQVSIVSYSLVFGYAGAVLLVGGSRTTDMAMKTHFRWIALGLVGAILASFLPYPLFPISGVFILFTFYKATRSLYPVGHFEAK
jgi:hypothetical protein